MHFARTMVRIAWLLLALAAGIRAEAAGLAVSAVEYARLPAGLDRGGAEQAWTEGRGTRLERGDALPATRAGEDLWLRIVWTNSGASARWVALELNDFFEDNTSIWVPDSAGGWTEHRVGERVPFSERSLWGREPVAWFSTPGQESFVTWLNARNDESQWPLFTIHDPADDYLKGRRAHDVWLGFYYGALLALAFYNVFLYTVLRRVEILYFLLYVAAFGVAFFLYQGLQFRWVPWLQSPHHNLLIALCSCASIFALVQFSRKFLAISQHIPGYDRWMALLGRFFGGLCGVLALYMLAIAVRRELWSDFPAFYLSVFKALALVTAAGYAVISIVAAAALRAGCREARFYLLGFGAIYLFLIPVLVSQARGTAAVSDIYWVQIGSCVEMLLFAFALADKLRHLRAEKNAAEEKALAETAERTRLERAHEEILRQKDRLEELDRQKSEFLGIAAHDLKNPLNAVQGIAVLLSADESLPASQRMPPEERREFLSDIEDSSHQMLGIIDSLLETDALEGGRLKLAREPHELSGLVERAWRGLARSAEAKRITVSLRVPLHLRVVVDRDRFQRVLENLFSNAIKYSPPGGAILLQAVQGELPGRIVIALQDSGPGFSAADMSQLFGRYRKLSARPTAGESSSGLGLYIVHRLLELQGGTIAVISPSGQSAIFRIEVPSA